MGLNKKILVGIMLVLFLITSNNNVFYGYENVSMIDEVLKNIEVSIKEYKVSGNFSSIKSESEIYDELVSKVNNSIGQVDISSKDKNVFKIYSGDEVYWGEIIILPYKKEYKVTFSISIDGDNLTFDKKDKLQAKLREVLSIFDSNVEYSLCVKSEILNNTMDEVRDVVINNLSLYEAKNTDEVKISNGYSIIGYTGLNNKKTILGKDIDFNCAIVKYSSGCYLIMGEPEITITY